MVDPNRDPNENLVIQGGEIESDIKVGCDTKWIIPDVLQADGTYLPENRECGELGYLCPKCAEAKGRLDQARKCEAAYKSHCGECIKELKAQERCGGIHKKGEYCKYGCHNNGMCVTCDGTPLHKTGERLLDCNNCILREEEAQEMYCACGNEIIDDLEVCGECR